jgi:hypothetical protein
MHKSQSLFNLTTAPHVLGVIITQHQEHKTTVITASGNCYTVLLSAAIVEKFHDVGVGLALSVLYGSQNRERPLFYISLTGFYNRAGKYLQRGTD